MSRATFLLPAHWDHHFHIQQKTFFFAYDNMSNSSQKRKAHETNDKSEDSSDFKIVAASLIQKKKSGPTSVKQRYVQERLSRYVAISLSLCYC